MDNSVQVSSLGPVSYTHLNHRAIYAHVWNAKLQRMRMAKSWTQRYAGALSGDKDKRGLP